MENHISINTELLWRYLAAEVTPDEKKEVEEWLKDSQENKETLHHICQLYWSTDALNTIQELDCKKDWRIIKGRIRHNKVILWGKYIQRAAAILFIPLFISWLIGITKTDKEYYREIYVNPGTISSVELPDGSKVWLNANSYLKYPLTFSDKYRTVTLEGEGYFSVTKDKRKKFIVETSDDFAVEVLGTEFNIDAYKKNENITTTLVEGQIAVDYFDEKGTRRKVLLSPEQKLVYNKNTKSISPHKAEVIKETAWKDGKIILRGTPLVEAVWVLSKKFNVEFDIKNEALKENSFTGIFSDQDLFRILEHFRLASGIQYTVIPLNVQNEEATNMKIELY